ncbi:MAG: PspC domain-containing protein [Gammaproteobacteria bacterium]|nr:PspC domain-containing protein [Gammaproteobacteria bacterium]
MTTFAGTTERRLYRDADKAVLGGVCAGLARYLGFNLKVTRFLAVIAFLCAMPFAIVGYLAAVFLIPSASSRAYDAAADDEQRKEALREEIRRAKPTVDEVRKRYESMDERLARIEKYVTSSRYELDEKFRRL